MEDLIADLNSLNELLVLNKNLVEAIGDCPNIEMPVFPNNPLWQEIESKGNIQCYVNVLSGRARLCRDNIRIANGSKNAMVEKLNRLTAKEFLRAGDVIGVSRNGLYEHYGIYIGNNKVIHYNGEADDLRGRITIHEAPMEEFIKESKAYFVVDFSNGIPIKIQRATTFLFNSTVDFYSDDFQNKKRNVYSESEAVKRAKSRIGEESYNLVSNNCEHFAMWCKTGVAESSQVKNLVEYAKLTGVCGYGLMTERL